MHILLYILLSTHITIICVTLYLHRSQAHKGIIFHPYISHFMRFYLWLTTGMVTKEWVAVHRKHHRYCEKNQDPHSPHVHGIFNVLFNGIGLYKKAASDRNMVNRYGIGTPDDYIEKNLYSKYSNLGIIILLLIDFLLFGFVGLFVWLVQIIWIPFWAAGVINGIGHYVGYTNGVTNDKSKNIIPVDFIIGGECLHNNHHLDPGNPKLSKRWFEFDIGYVYFVLLRYFKLAKFRYEHHCQW